MLIKEERLQQQLNDSSQYTLFQHQEMIYALPKNFFSLYQTIIDKLYLVLPGIAIAKQKGKDYIPEPALALSKALNPNHSFTVVDIEDQQALAFFANQPLPPLHSANGYLLLTYLGLPIGFVKQVGNRCNNLYQEAWRIRMNLPATLPTPFYTIVQE